MESPHEMAGFEPPVPACYTFLDWERSMRRIAIAGKGGSGKTTISGTLARLSSRALGGLLAVDGDPNPNLATVLGISHDGPWPLLPTTLLVREEQPNCVVSRLARPLSEILDTYGVKGPDGVRLLALGQVEAAGKG